MIEVDVNIFKSEEFIFKTAELVLNLIAACLWRHSFAGALKTSKCDGMDGVVYFEPSDQFILVITTMTSYFIVNGLYVISFIAGERTKRNKTYILSCILGSCLFLASGIIVVIKGNEDLVYLFDLMVAVRRRKQLEYERKMKALGSMLILNGIVFLGDTLVATWKEIKKCKK